MVGSFVSPARSNEPVSDLPTQADVAAAIESNVPGELPTPTDPSAAEDTPLENLQRDEALDLLNGVFEIPVQEAAGIYDDLQQARLLTPYIAVLPEGTTAQNRTEEEPGAIQESGESPSVGGRPGLNEDAEALPEAEARKAQRPPPEVPAELAEASLLDSTIPLEVDQGETLDLSLEREGDHLQPIAPLVQARIPADLGDGIELPEVGIGIELSGLSTERAASISDGSVAFFPNVAEDSDLAISPTPTGVETLTQLRSADSPATETYRLSLPADAELIATDAGGAEVREGQRILLSVPAPVALDSSGNSIPAELTVSGESLRVHVDAVQSDSFPILVDPLFQTYEWAAKDTARGICSSSTPYEPGGTCSNREEWGYDVSSHYTSHLAIRTFYEDFGIVIEAKEAQTAGDHATVLYTVPRYFKETPPPTSFVKSLKLSNVRWWAQGPSPSPYLFMGIWDSTIPGWVSYFAESGQTGHGLTDPAFIYNFTDRFSGASVYDRQAKAAEVSINATQSTAGSNARVNVGAATVELGDEDAPKPPQAAPQTQWVDQTAPPISFTTSDYGLGVYAVTVNTAEVDGEGRPLHSWKASAGCIGVGDAACPQVWDSSKWNIAIPNAQKLTFDPTVLPTGIDDLYLVAEDPVGNKSTSGLLEARVDHIAPTLALTGSMTEQDSLGTRRASYTLKATGSDGNAERPQSGIAEAEVKLDGKAVAMEGNQLAEWSPKCATENCALAAEWTLDTSTLAEGSHTVEVIATDAAGNTSTKTLAIETRPAPAPSLTLSGSITEQASLGTERPRYLLKAQSSALAAGSEAPPLGAAPAYTSSIGSQGGGDGQFYNPADVAVDSSGNAWVIDSGFISPRKLQEFDAKGEWVRSVGASGQGAGQLSGTNALAIDSQDNLWAADTGNNRIVEFNAKGEFVQAFGTDVNKTKVEAGGTEAERNLCTAASGDVCKAATAGTLPGQLKNPRGIALTAGGNIWVADTANNRLQKFSPTGAVINTISGEGAEPGKLKEPRALTVAPDGSIWVADTGNNRIEQWNSSLTFVRAVGREGSGGGEFKSPAAIEADSSGTIWVGDKGNNRVEQFDEAGAYQGSFGSVGAGTGQFSMTSPMGIAIDGKGSIWITDAGHYRVQRWLIPRFPVYTSSIGAQGGGDGQFYNPADVAVDSSGNTWVIDSAFLSSRKLQEFNAKGEWVRAVAAQGRGAGQMNSPNALAIDSQDNVWVSDTGNNRIVEFNAKGEFVQAFGTNVNKTKVESGGTEAEKNLCTAASGDVCQGATAGTLAGQLKTPGGIALTSGGNIWVADTANNRLQKFSPTGAVINTISGEGAEPGRLKEPRAVTVAPDGSIWVADTGNNRIEQWNSSLTFVRAVGREGSGGGEFKSPAAIEADSSGTIWVGDKGNNRVEVFGEGGRYFGQLGASGSGRFSFSNPMGLAIAPDDSIWVTDPGHYQVQRWTQENPRSEVTTTLWVDGIQQTGLHGVCKTNSCTIGPQWTVSSQALSPGSHSARIKTTDGLGRSTESSLSFEVAPDTTKPTLEASGELFNAPEGWVEQETYGLTATATDSGYGVTSISLKIDGSEVATDSQPCPDGACSESFSEHINMAGYAGGSHPAELIAADGSGNTLVKRWTINVDPEGHISTKEAEATLEAVESTTQETPIASTEELLEPEQMSLGDNPGLQQVGSQLTSTGVPDITTMSTNPSEGFTINSPYGETQIVPVVSEKASPTVIAEGVAGVSANAQNEVDSVIRPEYNGVQIFQAIRSDSSPEQYSWAVHLYEGQTLHLIDSHYAEVLNASGKRSFLITAEEAHDATGKEVSTSLEVNGNVLTLAVEFHKDTFVYPILAGAGWETAYRAPVLIEGPENELEIEAREQAEQEAEEATPPPPAAGYFTEAEARRMIASGDVAEEIIPAPDPPASGEASASSIPEKVVKPYKICAKLGCGVWWVEMKNPSYHYKRNASGRLTAYWQAGTILYSESWYPWYYWPELVADSCGNGFTGSNQVWAGEHKHLTIWARFRIIATAFTYDGDTFDFDNRLALQIWVWPNGFQQRVHGPWEATPEWIEHGGKCAVSAT